MKEGIAKSVANMKEGVNKSATNMKEGFAKLGANMKERFAQFEANIKEGLNNPTQGLRKPPKSSKNSILYVLDSFNQGKLLTR